MTHDPGDEMEDDLLDSHPNAPRRGPVWLAFTSVVLAGLFGALIGYGLATASCTERPSRLEQLLDAAVPGLRAAPRSCTLAVTGATLLGAAIAAVGGGVVAVLMLRAMSDWGTPRH